MPPSVRHLTATVRALARRATAASATPPAVVLRCYGKPGCTLCDKAKEPVARVARRAPVPVAVEWRDILDDPALTERWGERIPVITVGDRGETVLAEGKVSELWLRRALEAYLRDAGRDGARDGR